MFVESINTLRHSSKGRTPAKRRKHNWVHNLPFKMKFRVSGLYISVIPPLLVGMAVGVLAAIMGALPLNGSVRGEILFAGAQRAGEEIEWPTPYWWVDIGKTSMVLMLAAHDAGLGASQDFAEAATWYRRAAENGHAGAQYSLGTMYQNGWGVEADRDEAIRWYRLAATRGHVIAAARLHEMEGSAAPPAAPAPAIIQHQLGP